jgi:hypothetical protein
MEASPPSNFPQDARLDENDPVWRLLARAPRPEPDAWFAARTLARCRYEGPGVESGVVSLVRFARMWRWALGGGLALTLALALVVTQIHSEKADKQKNVQEAFEIMASIDTDSDSSSSPWQDSSF